MNLQLPSLSLTRRIAACLLITVMPGILHAAQPYPTKPVRLIVPFAPGGGTDIMARTLSQKLVELWGQQIVVDNRGGAGTVIGTEMTVRSPADGYTLMLANIAMALNPGLREKLPYDALRDLAPVILIASQPSAVAVNPTVPAKSVKELVKLAKADKLSFASSGIGGVGHIGGEMFRIAIGADMVHVPYKGGGPAATDLLGGQIPVIFSSLVTVMPQIQAGRLKALAVTEKVRYPGLPNVQAVAETIPGFEMSSWLGFFAPANLPAPIAARLNTSLVKALTAPDVTAKLDAAGLLVVGNSAAQFAAQQKSDYEIAAS